MYSEAEADNLAKPKNKMKTFNESQKSQKTVKSMIETKGENKTKEPTGKKNKQTRKDGNVIL